MSRYAINKIIWRIVYFWLILILAWIVFGIAHCFARDTEPRVTYISYCNVQKGDYECPVREFMFLSQQHRFPVTDGEIADVYHDPDPFDNEDAYPLATITIDKNTACQIKAQEDPHEEIEFWEVVNGNSVPIRCNGSGRTNTVLDEDY